VALVPNSIPPDYCNVCSSFAPVKTLSTAREQRHDPPAAPGPKQGIKLVARSDAVAVESNYPVNNGFDGGDENDDHPVKKMKLGVVTNGQNNLDRPEKVKLAGGSEHVTEKNAAACFDVARKYHTRFHTSNGSDSDEENDVQQAKETKSGVETIGQNINLPVKKINDAGNNGSLGTLRQTTDFSSLSKKDRKEFTAVEKLHILSLLEAEKTASIGRILTTKQLCEKYHISKSSLHRWKQQRSRLEELVAKEGMGGRKRDTNDFLVKIKMGLKAFAEENAQKEPPL